MKQRLLMMLIGVLMTLSGMSQETVVNLLADAIPGSWTTKPAPTECGWYCVRAGAKVDYPGNSRYENSPANYKLTKDSQTMNVNFLFIRWDGFSGSYVYPVELLGNTTYTFSMDCAYWNNNGNTGGTVSMSVNTDALLAGETIASKSFGTKEKQVAYGGSFSITTGEAGTYYLAFSSSSALYAISNLSLTLDEMQPTQILSGDQNIDNGGLTFAGAMKDGTLSVSGKTDLHLTSETSPIDNATINLVGNEAWLFFDYIKPSNVISDWLSKVQVDGEKATSKGNVRVAVYANGTVIIPGGTKDKQACLTVYDGENFTGNSKTFAVNTFYKSLGAWDNKIRSFRLRRGFQTVLANNSDGTGMSRCWIADTEDVEVPVMPEGMEKFVSFIRCVKHEWVSKKGWAGGVSSGTGNIQNVTCFYDWNCGGNTQDPDFEYTPIHQKAGWPSWSALYAVNDVSVLLNYNEPDDTGQANLPYTYAISTWPEMFKSGLRLASPASKDPIGSGWNRRFFATLDSLNYRCDIVAGHLYRQSMTGVNMRNCVNNTSNDSKGRPMWITEFNNGANWTTESWPDNSGPQRDADLNIIYDENGNEKTVNRPLSPNNAEKQRAWIEDIMNVLDETDKCERYFVYNWVQDARAMILDGKLTPAGKVYSAHRTALAYSSRSEYVHQWRIAPPWVTATKTSTQSSVTLSFYDHNGETGKKYVVECSNDGGEYEVVKELMFGTDYKAGATVKVNISLTCRSEASFRIRALSYKDTWSIYSRVTTVKRDAGAAMESLKQQIEQVRMLTKKPHTSIDPEATSSDETLLNLLDEIESESTTAYTNAAINALREQLYEAAENFLSSVILSDTAQPFDLTYLISNPDFAVDATTGWTSADAPNYGGGAAEFYQKTFDFKQTLTHAPSGDYRLCVQAFQRPGDYNTVATNYNAGNNNVAAQLYMGNSNILVHNIMDDAQTTRLHTDDVQVGSVFIANTMNSAGKYFDAGLYNNTVNHKHESGNLTIGLRCAKSDSRWWTIFDNFRLFYYGDNTQTGITSVTSNTSSQTTIYSLTGQPVSQPKRGIYIVNGKKMIVR